MGYVVFPIQDLGWKPSTEFLFNETRVQGKDQTDIWVWAKFILINHED